jgi:small-conductance mechanosensitive channel
MNYAHWPALWADSVVSIGGAVFVGSIVARIMVRRHPAWRLIQDLVVGAIYIGTVLYVIAYVFNAAIGTLIATSGVLAIILGLAMQSTLSNVFSGIALNIGRASSPSQGRRLPSWWRISVASCSDRPVLATHRQ